MLQPAQAAVTAKASRQLEVARRILAAHSPGLDHASLLLAQLRESKIDPGGESLQRLLDESADELQERVAGAWEKFQPIEWGDVPRPARPPVASLSQDVRKGLTARDSLLKTNAQRLQEALRAVDEALSYSQGEASARTHAEANQLKAVILQQIGRSRSIAAAARRAEADPFRDKLADLAARVRGLASSSTILSDSGIEVQMIELEAKAAEIEKALEADRTERDDARAIVEDLEKRLISARNRAHAARSEMDALRQKGLDFSDPRGADAFEANLTAIDAEYREALREAQALEFGTYPTAALDETGDYLNGAYVESDAKDQPVITRGLVGRRNDLTVLKERTDIKEKALEELRSDLARLEGMRNAFHETQERATNDLARIRSELKDAHAELNRLESEAFEMEQTALSSFEQAAKVAQDASKAAGDWVTKGLELSRELPTETRDRSPFHKRSQDGWMRGFMLGMAADSRLDIAWIQYQRFHSSQRTGRVLRDVVNVVDGGEIDLEAVAEKTKTAHDAGVKEVNQAVSLLERAHKDAGRHWTLVAQQAGTIYLLALFGHDEYVEQAREAYKNAIKGREDKSQVAVLKHRLEELESRSAN